MSELITTYLQDHHAGSVGGLESFKRVAQHHSDATVRETVGGFVDELRAEQTSLEGFLDALDGSTSTLKDAGAWAGEKAGRLKPNERAISRSPLSDLVELEMLVLGVHGKLLMWQALIELADPRLDAARLNHLYERAQVQEKTLAALRLTQVGVLHQE